MQKYRTKLQLYTTLLTVSTLLLGGLFVVCTISAATKWLLLALFLLFFFSLSTLISVLFMLYLPRLEKYWAKRHQKKKH